jgi:hypothetical protein
MTVPLQNTGFFYNCHPGLAVLQWLLPRATLGCRACGLARLKVAHRGGGLCFSIDAGGLGSQTRAWQRSVSAQV